MKKIIRIFGIILLAIVGMPLIFGVYIWVSNSIYLGSVDQNNTKYLTSNSSSSSNEEINEKFFKDIFDEEFYNSEVFLLGENHGFADVQKIDLGFIETSAQ